MMKIQVYDEDTDSTQAVQLKKEESYVFRRGWKQNFADRRRLASLEVVGLYWQTSKQQFVFSVLKLVETREREPPQAVNQE